MVSTLTILTRILQSIHLLQVKWHTVSFQYHSRGEPINLVEHSVLFFSHVVLSLGLGKAV